MDGKNNLLTHLIYEAQKPEIENGESLKIHHFVIRFFISFINHWPDEKQREVLKKHYLE